MKVPHRGFVTRARAADWEESLISGNGRLGALLRGEPAEDVVTFSHERLFLPTSAPLPPIDMAAHLPHIRAMVLDGRYQEAADLVVKLADETGYGGFRWTDPFVPAFDLKVTGRAHGEVREYCRGTDYETGEVSVSWQDDLGVWSRHLFVSRVDEVAVLRLQGPRPGDLNCTVEIAGTPGPADADRYVARLAEWQTCRADDVLGARAVFKEYYGRGPLGYQAGLRVVASGGALAAGPGQVAILNCDEVVVLVGLEMLEPAEDGRPTFSEVAGRLLSLRADYAELLVRHAAVHGELFRRARLDLGGGALALLPSEELLEMARAGDQDSAKGEQVAGGGEERATARRAEDALVEKLFDAGRYAIISSSGDLPPNLQGVWSGTYTPPWSGDYTHNGNVQTALAALLSTNTPELLLGYFSTLEAMLADFRQNSRVSSALAVPTCPPGSARMGSRTTSTGRGATSSGPLGPVGRRGCSSIIGSTRATPTSCLTGPCRSWRRWPRSTRTSWWRA